MAQMARRIVSGEESDIHDEPHLEGRRVTVRRLHGLVEGAGRPAPEVAAELAVEPADVYAALRYYHEHPEEMQTVERQRRRREQDAKAAGGKSVQELVEESEGEDAVPDSG